MLSADILFHYIFSKLSPSELLKIASVCKSWYSAINNPVLWKNNFNYYFSRYQINKLDDSSKIELDNIIQWGVRHQEQGLLDYCYTQIHAQFVSQGDAPKIDSVGRTLFEWAIYCYQPIEQLALLQAERINNYIGSGYVQGEFEKHFELASSIGYLDAVKLLLSGVQDIRITKSTIEFPNLVRSIYIALINGYIDIAKLLMPYLVSPNLSQLEYFVRYAFEVVLEKNKVQLLELLLGFSYDSGLVWSNNDLLDLASQHGSIEIARVLLLLGAEVNSFNKKGVPPLMTAISAEKFEMAQFLLENGANVHVSDNNGMPLLHSLVRGNAQQAITLLLKFNADINLRDYKGMTLCHYAVLYNKPEILEFLLKNGANINAIDNRGFTPLHHAVSQGNQTLITILLANQAKVEVKDSDGETVLHLAASCGNGDIIDLLLKHGANIMAVNAVNDTPLHLAIRKNQINAVHALLSNTMVSDALIIQQVSAVNCYGNTPLYYAVKLGNIEIIRKLIEKKANVKEVKGDGNTLLHCVASGFNNVDVAQCLLAHGADVCAVNAKGETPLHCYAQNENIFHGKLVNVLLSSGAILDAVDNAGNTPLQLALLKGNNRFIEELLQIQGVDLRAFRFKGLPPIYIAVQGGHLVVVKTLLLATVADINAVYSGGDTLLHVAVKSPHKVLVEYFIKHGAKVDVKNEQGLTPYDLARRAGHTEIALMLVKHQFWHFVNRMQFAGLQQATSTLFASTTIQPEEKAAALALNKVVFDKGDSASLENHREALDRNNELGFFFRAFQELGLISNEGWLKRRKTEDRPAFFVR